MLRLKQILITLLTVGIFFFLQMGISEAAANNQDLERTAVLVSPEASYEINIYPKPNRDQKRLGYGLGGDPVTVIEEVGNNEGGSWYFVRFSEPSQSQGWIEDNYVSLQKKEQGYLGSNKGGQQDNSARYRGDYQGNKGGQQDNSARYRGDYQGNR